MWKPEWNENVEAFVRNGGTLVIGAMTGTRDEHNHIPTFRHPGGASRSFAAFASRNSDALPSRAPMVFSACTDEFGLHIRPGRLPASSARRRYSFVLGNQEHEAAHLYELLEVDADVEVIGRWSSRFASGRAAITSRKVGEGNAIYMGTYLTRSLVERLADQLFATLGSRRSSPTFRPMWKSPCARGRTSGCFLCSTPTRTPSRCRLFRPELTCLRVKRWQAVSCLVPMDAPVIRC